MGFTLWDVVDFIPVVGTVARLGESAVLAVQGKGDEALDALSDAGMNVAGDALGLVTGGAGKLVVAGGRTVAKVAVKGARTATKVAEGGVARAGVKATEKQAMSAARKAAYEAMQKDAKASVSASRAAWEKEVAKLGANDAQVHSSVMNRLKNRMQAQLSRDKMARAAREAATTTAQGAALNLAIRAVTPEDTPMPKGEDVALVQEGVDPHLLALEGRPEMHLTQKGRQTRRALHSEAPPQLAVGKQVHDDGPPAALVLLTVGGLGVLAYYVFVSEG